MVTLDAQPFFLNTFPGIFFSSPPSSALSQHSVKTKNPLRDELLQFGQSSLSALHSLKWAFWSLDVPGQLKFPIYKIVMYPVMPYATEKLFLFLITLREECRAESPRIFQSGRSPPERS
jgi:hypothetical protein